MLKIFKYSLIAFTLIAILNSCVSNTDKKGKVSIEKDKIKQEKEINADTTALLLDNGDKWKANPETTSGIIAMQKLLNNFDSSSSTIEYKKLKVELEDEFTMVFKKCTMKGEAHNQLHNFLKPMIPIFEGLESDDISICKINYRLLDSHLKIFADFFE